MSDVKDTNPKDAAATSRLDLSLFPDSAVAYGALAFTEGDLKYGAYNWRDAGVQTSVYIAALRRHIAKYYNGEWADPKTRVPHLSSAIACIAVLIDAHEQDNLNDDRPPRQETAFYAEIEENVKHLQEMFPRRVGRYRATVSRDIAEARGGEQGVKLSDAALKQEPSVACNPAVSWRECPNPACRERFARYSAR